MRNSRLTTIILLGFLAAAGCGTVPDDKGSATDPGSTPPEQQQVIETEPAPAMAPAPLDVRGEPVPAVERAPVPVPVPIRRTTRRKPYVLESAIVRPAPVEPVPAAPMVTEQEMAAALAIVEAAMVRFAAEHAEFTAPSDIGLDAIGTSTLVLRNPEALDDLIDELASNEQIRRANIQISRRLEANVRGSDIGVDSASPATQSVSSASKWVWSIKPLTAGTGKLHLTMSMESTVDGRPHKHAVPQLDRDIVIVAPAPAPQPTGEFLNRAWIWMVAMVLVIVVAGIWKTRKTPRKA